MEVKKGFRMVHWGGTARCRRTVGQIDNRRVPVVRRVPEPDPSQIRTRPEPDPNRTPNQIATAAARPPWPDRAGPAARPTAAADRAGPSARPPLLPPDRRGRPSRAGRPPDRRGRTEPGRPPARRGRTEPPLLSGFVAGIISKVFYVTEK